uniref:THUMP domain-containing protein n=1 Tax=Heterorhabditis bacteriophora TaxID=37862 RepID=A0A1I7XJG8_HETBA
MADCMKKELLSMEATVIEEETSKSKTMFCYSGEDLEIAKIRDYQEHIVYGINYIEELSRIGRLIAMLNRCEENFSEKHLNIHLKLETSEKDYIWYRALQILQQHLPNHLIYEAKKKGWFWSVSVERVGTIGDCVNTTSKKDDALNVLITADRHSIYGGVLLYDQDMFRPHLTFWQLNGAIATTVVELAGIRDGDIILDMTCEYGDLILEVLQNYDCFCIGMSHKIDELAMAEVNWTGLQNWHRQQAGSKARHLQFIAAEFNKDFFNFNVVNKIMCTLPLRMSKAIPAVLDAFYDKLFSIISKCRQETHSVLLIPLLKCHILRVVEASLSSKYNFQILVMKHAMTPNMQMYICLLETKLPPQAVDAVNPDDISCGRLLIKTDVNREKK